MAIKMDKDEIRRIVDKVLELQDKTEPPYDLDQIMRKLQIDCVIETLGNVNSVNSDALFPMLNQITKSNKNRRYFDMPLLYRKSENMFDYIMIAEIDEKMTYFMKARGIGMYLFNRLAIGEEMTTRDLFRDGEIRDLVVSFVNELVLPEDEVYEDLMQIMSEAKNNKFIGMIERNVFRDLSEKYFIPSLFIVLRLNSIMTSKAEEFRKEMNMSPEEFLKWLRENNNPNDE